MSGIGQVKRFLCFSISPMTSKYFDVCLLTLNYLTLKCKVNERSGYKKSGEYENVEDGQNMFATN